MPDIPFAEKSFQDAGNHAKSCIKCTVDGGECFTSYFISAKPHNSVVQVLNVQEDHSAELVPLGG